MLFVTNSEVHALLDRREVIDLMREAVIAHSRGEGRAPAPILLDIPEERAEAQVKVAYRKGGSHFVLKLAGGFYGKGRPEDGISTSAGLVILFSARSGEPVAYFADDGHMTDVRTAATVAMTVRELGRDDRTLGVLGTGIQARLQAVFHAEVLPITSIRVWGRTPGRMEAFARDMRRLLPDIEVRPVSSPAHLLRDCRLLITATPSQSPVLMRGDVQPGTHISAIGADSPGKQELDPQILRDAALVLVDDLAQCRQMGELQHVGENGISVQEVGAYCVEPVPFDTASGITVVDFTGLALEDLYVAEYAFQKKSLASSGDFVGE